MKNHAKTADQGPAATTGRPAFLTVGWVTHGSPNSMVAEVAVKLSVSHGVVYYWVEHGILPARRQAANRPYWITLTEAKAQELKNLVQSSKRIAKPSTTCKSPR